MNKKVLVISYSQTGQLDRLTQSVISPLKKDKDVEVVVKNIQPVNPYPFPWDFMTFMDTFPESVYLDPPEILPIEDDENDYDLVILPYQVWFLSPSLPITAFLKSDYAKRKLRNKPVITLIGCRNMWIMAQEKVKGMLKQLNAILIDNIVLIDQGDSFSTFVTTPRWMLTGKKDSLWNLFPKAGISNREIEDAKRFGNAIKYALQNNKEKNNRPICDGLRAVNVDVKLIKSEKIATKSFKIWGGLIRKIGPFGSKKRRPVVMLYVVFLLLIILTIVPLNMLIQTILRKIDKQKVLKQKEFYELPSGNGDYRMKEFL
ncbi:dialkylrecorsinol condensing enzyme [Arcobacter sp. CECT 8985]|uniref:dialkylrecorsinol condensing enzyme n=1 Tax=Arcobacter sp. CECT 8985 TaxID=1935424 RepID=UPI00100A4598|nr:dialkylrecorsinol condensing enzyme [Arcobacter sp. CECT 8985]RXJ85606.1 dialkylrecorsinol condensing enzyme [Arcobacter sp. CECT 8985]